jgi:hypothetical protein
MFNKNDYETPSHIAAAMCKLILPTDKRILEPCAGTGQILKHIVGAAPVHSVINWCEINNKRAVKLPKWIPGICSNFLDIECDLKIYDLIITNPPFDYALEFIEKSLTLLNDDPHSRLIYLLPIDTFSSKVRASYFQSLDCHISNISIIPGRIDYLKDGVPVSKTQKVVDGVLQYGKNGKPIMCSGRQISDAIFTIKKGKGNVVNFVEV